MFNVKIFCIHSLGYWNLTRLHDLVKKPPGWFDLCWPESKPCPLHCLLKVGSKEFREEVKGLGHKIAPLIGCLVSMQPLPGCNIQNHINQAWWSVTEISALRSWGRRSRSSLATQGGEGRRAEQRGRDSHSAEGLLGSVSGRRSQTQREMGLTSYLGHIVGRPLVVGEF